MNKNFDYLSPMNLLEDSDPKLEMEFDFAQQRIWEKRDYEIMSKDSKESSRLLPDDDMVGFKVPVWCQCNCNNTLPCHSLDMQSLEEYKDNLDTLSLVNEYAESVFIQPEVTDSNPAVNLIQSKGTSEEAVILKSENDVKIRQWRRSKLINSQPQDKASSHVSSMLELAKKSSEIKENDEPEFEWNNFLVRRACFRGISVYYKNKFSPINTSWQRKRVNKKKKTSMHVLIKEFASNEFGDIVQQLDEEQWTRFRDTLYSILFSHRFKKQDDFLEGVEFSTIRGVLYSYTTEARVELISNPFFSLMVLNFLEKGTTSFFKSKVIGKPKLYSEELQAELDALHEEASIQKIFKSE